MADKEHKVSVKQSGDKDFERVYGGAHIAWCTCGWESEQRSTHERAELSAAAHLAAPDGDVVAAAPAEPEEKPKVARKPKAEPKTQTVPAEVKVKAEPLEAPEPATTGWSGTWSNTSKENPDAK